MSEVIKQVNRYEGMSEDELNERLLELQAVQRELTAEVDLVMQAKRLNYLGGFYD